MSHEIVRCLRCDLVTTVVIHRWNRMGHELTPALPAIEVDEQMESAAGKG